jgi:hypothetical protein
MTELEQYQPRAELTLSAQDVAVQRLGEWAQSAQAAYSVAESLVRTSFVPEGFRGKPHEATAAILSGLEVGLSPMASLRSFDVIQGTAAPRAITLRAIVQSKGHVVDLIESTGTRCVMEGTRKGSSRPQRVTWTLDRAKQLGLTNKPNWKNQPQAMLLARTTSEVCRLIAADAILGIAYTAEELADGPTVEQVTSTQTTDATPATSRRMSRAARPVEPPPAADPDEPAPPADEDVHDAEEVPDGALTDKTRRHLFALFNEQGWDRDSQLAWLTDGLGRVVDSRSTLTEDEAQTAITVLRGVS